MVIVATIYLFSPALEYRVVKIFLRGVMKIPENYPIPVAIQKHE